MDDPLHQDPEMAPEKWIRWYFYNHGTAWLAEYGRYLAPKYVIQDMTPHAAEIKAAYRLGGTRAADQATLEFMGGPVYDNSAAAIMAAKGVASAYNEDLALTVQLGYASYGPSHGHPGPLPVGQDQYRPYFRRTRGDDD